MSYISLYLSILYSWAVIEYMQYICGVFILFALIAVVLKLTAIYLGHSLYKNAHTYIETHNRYRELNTLELMGVNISTSSVNTHEC